MRAAHVALVGRYTQDARGTRRGAGFTPTIWERGRTGHGHYHQRHDGPGRTGPAHATVPTMLATAEPATNRAAGPAPRMSADNNNADDMATNRPYQEAAPPQWGQRHANANTPANGANSTAEPEWPPPNAMSGARALDALIWSQGQPAVAAERLGLKDADSVLAAIVMDDTQQERLRTVMRSFAMLRLLGTAQQMEDLLMERVEQLDAQTIAKLFAQVLTLADQMTRATGTVGTATGTTDPREALLKALPANVRQALRVVHGGEMDDAILNPPDEQAG